MSVGRNDPCPCGSGEKYKKCCLGGADPATKKRQQTILILSAIALVAGIAGAIFVSKTVGLGIGLGGLFVIGTWVWLTAPPPKSGSKGDPGAINFGR
ncbi:MAG: SEC-C metal-binding domain-containing protein [Acidobacteriota bacterium]